jgi:hypothetical protein
MAHYALLNDKYIVVQVITGKDETEGDGNWESFYSTETGLICKRTSYNTYAGVHREGGTPFRKNYAGIGFTYDVSFDAFIPPRPFPSWKLNYNTFLWDAPVAKPTDGKIYCWDENNTQWVEITKPA